MTRRVIMVDPTLALAPEPIRDEARLRIQEIAEGLEGIPADSAFWASVKVSRLCLSVQGWLFFYTVEGQTLHVTEARPG
ncbi:MAG TPA: hypothetical protein VMK66_03590 [Myxococcales bacterium]|nr:hypothetical protein [Myxococcales bacterium]